MLINVAETFELLFDKNNNTAYKTLNDLQKESEEMDCVYPYMDRLSNMFDSDNSYILLIFAQWDSFYLLIMLNGIKIIK